MGLRTLFRQLKLSRNVAVRLVLPAVLQKSDAILPMPSLAKSCEVSARESAVDQCIGGPKSSVGLIRRLSYFLLGTMLLQLIFAGGCSRSHYRARADQEAYCLVESRQLDPLWDLPPRTVEPQMSSRMQIGANLDCAPKPMDDAAAQQFMDCPDGYDNTKYYSKIPTQGHTESPIWIDYLPRDETNQIKLTQPLAIDLALLHSRDYQTQFEQVYLSALELSGNRFEFDTQWFGGLGTGFTATGSDLGNQRLLQVSDRLGFSRNLAGGGQFATNILNSLFWDFGSSNLQGGSAALVTTFSQPLLRGAFRYVRLENLTQAERNLLYQVRDFARFRRNFHLDITSNYLSLLTQVQAIRNTQANVENLRRNLVEYEELVALKEASQIQVDQVFLQYQNARLSLLSSEQALTASLDQFKFQLGLPPWVPFKMDESLLEPFELTDSSVEQLQQEVNQLYLSLVQYLRPERAPQQFLSEGFANYMALRDRAEKLLPQLEEELARWMGRLKSTEVGKLNQDDRLELEQQTDLAKTIETRLADQKAGIEKRKAFDEELRQKIAAYDNPSVALDNSAQSGRQEKVDPAVLATEALQDAVGKTLRQQLDEIYVAQSQIRIFLIDIEPVKIQEEQAITFAHRRRLDLMNSQALVMDSYRKVEVAANALKSSLNVTGSVALGSDPGKNNAFRFDSSANTYRLGAQFDGPLNRLNERNLYRAQQLAYQRASRSYVSDKDRVANEVRSILRQLELRRLNFQIARQQLVAATRQVDQAQFDLRTSTEANLTLYLLQALQGMLDAKNNLISNWIDYRVQKMRLFVALEMLYLDERGEWINAETGLVELEGFQEIDEEYFPLQWVDLEDLSPPPVADEATVDDVEKINGSNTEELILPESQAAGIRPAEVINLVPPVLEAR